ncbi:hypothetical protein Tco_0729283 [Tanacetum coccineum]|uniref:Uncharacterized protein n=1 Tax=Tanacetum coccineum TaxID=301880 RepID=A0ABQ4YR68_9ASTR
MFSPRCMMWICIKKPPTAPKEKKEKKSGKGKQKTTELETISEAVLTEPDNSRIITKKSRKETQASHASGSGADEGTGVTPGVRCTSITVLKGYDDVTEQPESEDDGDDFIHPKSQLMMLTLIHEAETDEDEFFRSYNSPPPLISHHQMK